MLVVNPAVTFIATLDPANDEANVYKLLLFIFKVVMFPAEAVIPSKLPPVPVTDNEEIAFEDTDCVVP